MNRKGSPYLALCASQRSAGRMSLPFSGLLFSLLILIGIYRIYEPVVLGDVERRVCRNGLTTFGFVRRGEREAWAADATLPGDGATSRTAVVVGWPKEQ